METQSHKKRLRSSSNASTGSLSGSTERPLKACRSQRGDIPTDVQIGQPNIIHWVKCSRASEYHSDHPLGACYLDVPALPANGNRATALHGQKPLLDVESYLAGWIDFKFVVYLEYDCEAYHKRIEDRFTRLPMPSMPHSISIQSKPYFQILQYDGPPAKANSERIQLSDSLEKALCALRDHNKEPSKEWKLEEDHVYPYQKLYHFRNMCVEPSLQAPGWQHNIEIVALFHYLAKRLSSSYEELAKLSAAGMADRKFWAMLFQPDDIILTTQSGQFRAFTVSSCHLVHEDMLIMNCWSWEYDGNFFRKQITRSHVWPSSSEQIRITELPVYPLRYAADGVESGLRERGETFWACRRQKYVNYNVPLQGLGSQLANLRYMVDMEAYKLMHGSDDDPTTRNELSNDAMESDEPPSSSFTIMLPATIHGYGFHDKKWKALFVEHIRDIKWNKEIFEHQLVLQEGKKELVKALVSVHIEKDGTVGTDFMDGKGEGLIILLHGGPGTGKTLTAESIAELVERPLYRVTCGDIGTDAESVEKYLESVLYIGSNWKCVVLMDEADVFLEERTKLDMQRNALVSVFLRVLEYYNGILILTTNRIGTFDEAFKSRIQLALHYPPLDRDGRWEVWRNFVQSLSEVGENINTEDISKKLDILARHKLNGRQIRNTINTARQLACYKKETIRYAHIDQAIGVVNEFEKYVTDVHGHDDEEYAQDQGLRNDQALRDGD